MQISDRSYVYSPGVYILIHYFVILEYRVQSTDFPKNALQLQLLQPDQILINKRDSINK